MKYYKVLMDDTQSVWLVTEKDDKSIQIYSRQPCSIDGKLTKVDNVAYYTCIEDVEKFHRVFEISEDDSFIELL